MSRHVRKSRYRHRIDIIPDGGSQDSAGQHVPSYTGAPRATDWPADVRETAEGEQVYGIQIQATTTHLIECRYVDNVVTTDRIRWKREGLDLNIVSSRHVQHPKNMLLIEAKVLAS